MFIYGKVQLQFMKALKYLSVMLSIILCSLQTVWSGGDAVVEKTILPSLNKQRASNAFYNTIHFQKLSASRFLPLFNVTGIGSWASPRTVITLDGLPYNGYPFGMQSIDLVPVDLVTIDTLVAKTGVGVIQSGPVSGGTIDFVRSEIPDSFSIDTRLFTGSETGDPLIHIFSRPDERHINKNKVGPSFALSISNKNNNWAYRLSGGGFFYFTTGSVNDGIIGQYNRELLNRQNRQVKVIGEIRYTIDEHRALDFFAAGINLFGWEMSPFTSLFNHYTNISNTGRIRYTDTSSGFTIALVRDESFVWTKQITGSLPTSLRTTEWMLYPRYDISLNNAIDVTVSSYAGLINAIDRSDDNPRRQPVLLQNVSAIHWGFGIDFNYAANRLFSSAGIRIDSQYEYSPELSGELLLEYRTGSSSKLYTLFGTAAYFPDYLEQYGYFFTERSIDNTDESGEFEISGNPDLDPERVHEIKAGYSQTNNHLTVSAELFGRWTENQLMQIATRSYRPADTGELLRSANYGNNGHRFVPGITLQLDVKPVGFLRISSEHQYIDNAEIRSLPRYKNIHAFEFLLPLDVVFDVSLTYTGSTVWEEFILAPEDDAFEGAGFDGTIRSATILDMSVSRRFEKFYFANGLEVSIQAQNFFNEPYRRIPIGNFIDRAVFVYVSFGL